MTDRDRSADEAGVETKVLVETSPSLNDTLQTASSRGRLTMALALALGLSATACENGSSSDSTTENTTTPDDGQEMGDGDGDGDTQDTGMDMMNEVPPTTPDITSPLTVELAEQDDKTPITGEVDPSQKVEAVLVIDANLIEEGMALPPAIDMADLDLESGQFTYNAGLGKFVFVAEAESGLQSTPSQTVEVIWNDPCAEIMCGPHGTCVDGACNCDEGYTKEGDECVDLTAPEAPVIETNFGDPLLIGSADLVLEGSSSSDTTIMGYRIDQGLLQNIPDFIPNSGSWNLTTQMPLGVHTLCVEAKKHATGDSSEDCIEITRGA